MAVILKPVKVVRSCNTCNNEAQHDLVFKDKYSQGSTVIKLCNSCLNDLKQAIK